MPPRRPGQELKRLQRVLAQVAAGRRRAKDVGVGAGMSPRAAQAVLLHAAWLGLLEAEPVPHLSDYGVAFAFARAGHAGLLRAAVAAATLFAGAPEDLPRRLRVAHPGLDEAQAERHAASLSRLLADAGTPSEPPSAQLALPFTASPPPPLVQLHDDGGRVASLDAYLLVLRALLDAGELTLPTLRGVLDRGGAQECSLGLYAQLAVARGDATRHGDVLVVTGDAVDRVDLAEGAAGIALSDEGFRRHVEERLAGGSGGSAVHRAWEARVFGSEHPADALPRVLLGRALDSVPLAGEPRKALPSTAGPWLGQLGRAGLAIAFPSSLVALAGGFQAAERACREAASPAVRVPGPAERRVAVHGGLLAPGEPLPRVLADPISLRLRAMAACPAIGIVAALGLLHREGVARVRLRGGHVVVEARRARPRSVVDVIATAARARGWVVVTGPASARWADLVEVGVALGVVRVLGDLVVLDETLFVRLGSDPEHRAGGEGLGRLRGILAEAVIPAAG